MKCPYCGTENPEDAKECSNCSADLAAIPKGPPPPESVAPTMMSSAADIATMLAAAKAEKDAPMDESSEMASAEPASEMPVVPPDDYSAPTMMSSASEVAAMVAAAKAEREASSTETSEDVADVPMDEPVESVAPTPDYSAPTMMSSASDVAAMLAAAKAENELESPQDEPTEPVQPLDEVVAEERESLEVSHDFTAPTLIGIPDPLGIDESEEADMPVAPPEPEPLPAFKETPTPFFNEPVVPPPAPVPATPIEIPVTPAVLDTPPKDNNQRMWIIGGLGGCVGLCCLCSLAGLVINYVLPMLQ